MNNIIWIDWPLAIISVLFLLLGYLYGFGLLYFFRYDFRWSYASVIGILSVVSCLVTLVGIPRYGQMALAIYWSEFVVYSMALPGMLWVDRVLRQDRKEREAEITRLRRQVGKQQEEIRQLKRKQQETVGAGGHTILREPVNCRQ
jgi:hypothetical protein